MNAALVCVGGHASRFGRMRPKIEGRGFRAVHWTDTRPPSLPSDTVGVLIYQDSCSPMMADHAVRLAKRFGTPVLFGDSNRWTPFAIQLDTHKIVAPVPVPVSVPVSVPLPQPPEPTMLASASVPALVPPSPLAPAPTRGQTYALWVRQMLTADPTRTTRSMEAELHVLCTDMWGSAPTNFLGALFSDARRELGITPPPPVLVSGGKKARPEPSDGVCPACAPPVVAVATTVAAVDAPPAWYTQDFRDALGLLRAEMARAGVTKITDLDAGTFTFERVVVVRGSL